MLRYDPALPRSHDAPAKAEVAAVGAEERKPAPAGPLLAHQSLAQSSTESGPRHCGRGDRTGPAAPARSAAPDGCADAAAASVPAMMARLRRMNRLLHAQRHEYPGVRSALPVADGRVILQRLHGGQQAKGSRQPTDAQPGQSAVHLRQAGEGDAAWIRVQIDGGRSAARIPARGDTSRRRRPYAVAVGQRHDKGGEFGRCGQVAGRVVRKLTDEAGACVRRSLPPVRRGQSPLPSTAHRPTARWRRSSATSV